MINWKSVGEKIAGIGQCKFIHTKLNEALRQAKCMWTKLNVTQFWASTEVAPFGPFKNIFLKSLNKVIKLISD